MRVIPLGIDRTIVRAIVRRSSERSCSDRAVRRSVFERRRVDRLIAAFDRVADRVPDARLEIVGENRTRIRASISKRFAAARAHADRISIRSYVDEPTLAALYRRASVFAFLSEYEGFGLTPLEALAAGVPPVVLDTPVARETCGGGRALCRSRRQQSSRLPPRSSIC